MKLKPLIAEIERIAPPFLMEGYDNAGLLIGSPDAEIEKAVICLDVTEEVLEEAIREGYDLVISHHPLIFKGLKRLNAKNDMERMVIKAVKNDINIYAVHTNIDNVRNGVNGILGEKLGLINTRILLPKKGILKKLVTFCPVNEAEKVREAVFEAGAGNIGNYDSCSFNVMGKGSFRANEEANPFVGEIDELHFEEEVRIEVVYPVYHEREIITRLLHAHPYEEVAYDIYPLDNEFAQAGSGMLGKLRSPMDEQEFIAFLKDVFSVPCIRHSNLRGKKIENVAVCGGSGSFLIQEAKRCGADVFITGDVKYHDFFEGDTSMIIIDVGHYESEQFTKELIFTVLKQKFPTFALQISKVNTNPVNYI